jgi:hypothetical protein
VNSPEEIPVAKRHVGSKRSPWPLWLLLNGPPIVTVLASSVLAAFAWVVEFTPAQTFQIILALLALIGTSLVTEKLIESRFLQGRLRDIDTRLEQVLEARTTETLTFDRLVTSRRDLTPLEERLLGATRIAISGGSLFRLLNEYKNLFEQLARSGCQMRFVITDPNGPAAESLRIAISYESNNVDTYRAHVRYELTTLCELSHKFPQNCHVRLCSLVLPFSLLRVDNDVGKSVQVELYPFSVPARDRPIFMLREQTDPRLFSFFSIQFETLWSDQFTVPCDPQQLVNLPSLSHEDAR